MVKGNSVNDSEIDQSESSRMSLPEETLQGVLACIIKKTFPSESTFEIKPISSDGANYTSALFEASVTTPEGQIELFAKVANMAESMGADLIFKTEKYVYTNLIHHYEKLQDRHNITEHRYEFPKFYGCNQIDETQTVVMENLVARGYEPFDRFTNISWGYASKAMEVLAKFHALSLAYRKEQPEEFEELVNVMKMPPWTNCEKWQGLIDGALGVLDGEDRERVARCLEGCVGWSKMRDFSKPRKTAVIAHGDYRPSNLMHKELDGEYEVIAVDYQTVRFGCPVSDLVYFIVSGSDQLFRRKYYHQLVDHYYEQLSLAMGRLGLVAEEVYGREDFEADLKEKLSYGVYVGVMTLPFVTVAPEDAPRFDRGEVLPRVGALFAERFRALVQDYKHWGLI